MPLQAADTIADISVLDARSNRTGIAQTEGTLVAHCVYSEIDADVDVEFEQSLDDTNYDGVFDSDGEKVKIRCLKVQGGNTDDHCLMASVVGLYAPYVRAVVRKGAATQGALEVRMFV